MSKFYYCGICFWFVFLFLFFSDLCALCVLDATQIERVSYVFDCVRAGLYIGFRILRNGITQKARPYICNSIWTRNKTLWIGKVGRQKMYSKHGQVCL